MNIERHVTVLDPDTHIAYKDGAIFVARRVVGAPKFKMVAAVLTGSLNDKIPGEGHVFEHCPFEQTEAFPDNSIRDYAKKRGGRVGASTGFEKTSFTGEGKNEYADDIIFAVSELACKPAFTKIHFAHEKGVILTEWAERSADEQVILYHLLAKAAIHPATIPSDIIGDYDTINSIEYEDAMGYFTNNYFSDRLIVAMEGDVEPARMLDSAQKRFTLPRGLQASSRTFAFNPHTVTSASDDSPATTAHLLFHGPNLHDDGYQNYLASMAQYVLIDSPGPIYNQVRAIETPLVYGVRSGGGTIASFQLNGFTFTAFPKNLELTINGIARAAKGFVENPDRNQIEQIRERGQRAAVDNIKRNPEIGVDNLVRNIFYRDTVYPRDYWANYYSQFTCEEIVDTVKKLFLNGQMSIVYRGTIKSDYPDHVKAGALFKVDQSPRRNANMDVVLIGQAGQQSSANI